MSRNEEYDLFEIRWLKYGIFLRGGCEEMK